MTPGVPIRRYLRDWLSFYASSHRGEGDVVDRVWHARSYAEKGANARRFQEWYNRRLNYLASF